MASPSQLNTKVGDYNFAYFDSGSPGKDVYNTIIIVHGNTHHAGTFLSLFPHASAFSFRIIPVQRRLYGSTLIARKKGK
ncbi:hypothetical protein D9757_015313 [Collybiopsis confluens]|uniref:Uncharacterized protein n=1 Tax=Collybiopsis confluens TaxID=2823264 RepID=A0A8H5CIG0_9AGAR|nr:hypothetical protein D9757_015313 [Collybiopsis confluens]